jgi:Protein of unknown function (DUF3443)
MLSAKSRILRPTGLIVSIASALCFACGGGSSSHANNTIAGSASNVQSISVNAGPTGNYANGVFTSVTVCAPGSSTNCQTIDNVLVDTGSYGLRLLSSAGGGELTLSLPQQTEANGNPVGECYPFVSGYTWGPVVTADFTIAGETAGSLPVQVIDPTFAAVPAGCTDFGLPPQNTLTALGTNGILGVGPFVPDCGSACAASGNANPGIYYVCASSSCSVTPESLTQQVQNPVGSFATDNNGVVVEFPSVNGAAASLSGSLVFGIGTESNNALGSATVLPMNQDAEFSTTFNGQTYQAFIDSGSNAFFFLDSAQTSLPVCGDDSDFYCPTSLASLSATAVAASGGATSAVNFSIGDADALFSNATEAVFPTLGGPNSGSFDWGLPFFFGRNVFVAISGSTTPGGTGPYWAF